MIYIIKNEQHRLLPDQEKAIREKFNTTDWEYINIPSKGLTILEMEELFATEIYGRELNFVFLSPIPYMMKMCCEQGIKWYVFHNDHREKKELPDGRVIMTVAKEGWEIL